MFLALIALFCAVASVYFESAAERNRFMVAGNDEILKRQNLFQLDRVYMLLYAEVSHSRIHSQAFFKESPSWISWQKEKAFFNVINTFEKDINYIKTLSKKDFNDKSEVNLFILEAETFIQLYKENNKFNLLNRNEHSEKFRDLQNLLKKFIEIMRLRSDNRLKEIELYNNRAINLSKTSAYLILVAFLFEFLIFILIQILEVKSERRMR